MKCINEQFITRNHNELARVILAYRELEEVYEGNVCLYLDNNIWEIFDMRIGKVLIRHEFKHLSQLIADLKELKQDIILLGYYSVHPNKVKKQSARWSFKRLSRLYDDEQIKYFTHGKEYKTENLADCN